MDDVRVRKAFNMAIDKVGAGRVSAHDQAADGVLARGHFPRLSAAGRRSVRSAARAKQLLAEAGYRDASGSYDPSTVSDRRGRAHLQHHREQPPDRRVRAGAVEAEPRPDGAAQEHGVEDVPRLPREARIQGRRAGRLGRRLHGSVHVPRALHHARPATTARAGSTRSTSTCCARRTAQPDPAKRYELLAQAEKMLLDAQPVIPLATSSTNWMKKPYVKGMYPNPVTMHAWKFVYIEHDPAKWDRRRTCIAPLHRPPAHRHVPMVLVVVSLTWGLIRLAPGNFYTGEKALPPAIEKNIRERVRARQAVVRAVRQDAGEHAARRFRDRRCDIRASRSTRFCAQAVPVSATLGLAGVSAGARRRHRRGHVCGAAAEHAARLHVDGGRDGRHFGAELRARTDARAAVRADVVLAAAGAVGRLQRHLILPVLTLSAVYMAYIARLTRSGMLEVLRSNYIRTARAKGLPERQILMRHAMRGGLLPVVSFSGPALALPAHRHGRRRAHLRAARPRQLLHQREPEPRRAAHHRHRRVHFDRRADFQSAGGHRVRVHRSAGEVLAGH